MSKKDSITNIHNEYKKYRGQMNNIWEEYTFLEEMIRHSPKREYQVLSLYNNSIKTKRSKDAGGMQNRFLDGNNSKAHFLDTVELFEYYVATLVKKVYIDYPDRLRGINDSKALDAILNNTYKGDMINCLVEEKVRSIFYGNIKDIFIKDKCGIGINQNFAVDYKNELDLLTEIVGRRNIIIHNSGRVDSKYLKENRSSKLIKGQKVQISEKYLRGTIGLLEGLAAKLTVSILSRTYLCEAGGTVSSSAHTFDVCHKNAWFRDLLCD